MGKTIGFFDSGVGGLAIWKAVQEELPHVSTLYVADQKFFPYGEKPSKLIQERARKIAHYLAKQGCALLVIACNTATVLTIGKVRKEVAIPVVGVEPAIKPAAARSKNKHIVVFATSLTKNSGRERQLTNSYGSGVKVEHVVVPELIALVEAGKTRANDVRDKIKKLLHQDRIRKADTIILGSTHYMWLKEELREVLPQRIRILEPSRAVAKQVKRIWREDHEKDREAKKPRSRFLTTGSERKFQTVINGLLHRKAKVKKLVL